MPLKIIYFNGTHATDKNVLSWEIECDNTLGGRIELQKSIDGITWITIQNLPADGTNCNSPLQFPDYDLRQSVNYYRIKLTEVSGSAAYSRIMILKNTEQITSDFRAVPNPVNTDGNLQLLLNNIPRGLLTIRITDMQGRLVYTSASAISNGQQQVNLNISKLMSGTYELSGTDKNGFTKTIKIIKL